LLTGTEVDDAQPTMSQRRSPAEVYATFIGPAVPQDIRHLANKTLLYGSTIKIHETRNAAHVSSRR
jgi:hypothetical protein